MANELALGIGVGLWLLAIWSALLGLIALLGGSAPTWPGKKPLSGRIDGLEFIAHAGAALLMGVLIATNTFPVPLLIGEVVLLSAGFGLHTLARRERARTRESAGDRA